MATAERLEARSQEDCVLKKIQACTKLCQPNCPHYLSINDKTLSEQDLERRYRAFIKDPDYTQ